ncbi:hypothetical protein GCM10012278_87170 [Nonomuraea glycinis]|uniref:Uncharacterized protein n=1 Tax=Nonomuraea glycinis TaxID=2047744 RepID=A0A918EAR5_9ACTN|nr:hypothetical protein GCM10012278_87170 [Nonomuraea glycinis]
MSAPPSLLDSAERWSSVTRKRTVHRRCSPETNLKAQPITIWTQHKGVPRLPRQRGQPLLRLPWIIKAEAAAERTTSLPRQRYLHGRAARLTSSIAKLRNS